MQDEAAATNPLLLAFGDGPGSYSPEQQAALTALDAWQLSMHDEAAVFSLVGLLVERASARLPMPPEAQEIFSSDIADYLKRDRNCSILSVVEMAMQQAIQLKRFDPQESRPLDTQSQQVDHPIPVDVLAAYNAQRLCADKSAACHAASTSMFFGRNGFVSACCDRRHPPYGSWPAQSVAEMWFGTQRRQLEQSLRNNILPHGCELCSTQILAGNFRGTVAASFDTVVQRAAVPPSPPAPQSWFQRLFAARKLAPPAASSATQQYPLRLEFELSNKCNLECTMCSGDFSSLIRANREGKPPLNDQYDERFVQQLREFIPHLKEADFRGGEPFLIDIYRSIWELLIELNPDCVVSITTNGTAFSPAIRRILEHLNVHLIISIDSLQQSTYESIRRNASLDRVLENIDAFYEIAVRRNKTMGFAFCIMPSNWHEVPDLLAFAAKRNASIRMNTVYFPGNCSIGALPAHDQTRIATFLRESLQPPTTEIEAANNAAVEGFCLQIESWTAHRDPASLVQIS